MPQVLESILSTYRALAGQSQLERLKRHGHKEARAVQDDAGATHLSACVSILQAEADDAKGRYDAHYNERLREYDEECNRLDEEIVQVYTAQEGRVRDQKNAALTQLHTTFGPGSGSWSALAREDASAHIALEHKRASLGGRPPRIRMRHIYLPFMSLLAVLESPINRLSFELFFEGAPVIALGMAFVAGAVLMFLAHTLGANISRWHSGARFGRVTATGIILLVSAAVIYGLGLLRNEFAALAQQGGPNLADLLRSDRIDVMQVGASLLSKPLSTEALVLLAMNIGLYVMGTIASSQRHDPDPDYETILRRQERARKAFNKRKTEYDERTSGINAEFDEKIERLGSSADEAREQLARVTATRAAWSDRVGDDDDVISATFRQRKFAYVKGYFEGCTNSRARAEIAQMLESIKPSSQEENVVGLQRPRKV